MLVDTHCHIHESSYPLEAEQVLKRAHAAEVDMMICVGTSLESSRQALDFAFRHADTRATIGVHPHETPKGYDIRPLVKVAVTNPVAIGEIGLDYFYDGAPRQLQLKALETQLQVAIDYSLPVSFHVREAFDDFWSVFNNFSGLRGVLHSFTDSIANLEKGLAAGLYIGLNGISTFSKKPEQQAMFDAVPLNRVLLETDAPFLTPPPYRGTTNEPAYVRLVAQFHAKRRHLSLQQLADQTTANAQTLFHFESSAA